LIWTKAITMSSGQCFKGKAKICCTTISGASSVASSIRVSIKSSEFQTCARRLHEKLLQRDSNKNKTKLTFEMLVGKLTAIWGVSTRRQVGSWRFRTSGLAERRNLRKVT
jgi:hypothetical protein